jgi:major intrinsic protein
MARATARLRATVWGELLAEFLGTFVLIAFGDGVVAMAVAALNQSGRGTEIFAASGDWLLIAWGWALAVAFAVYGYFWVPIVGPLVGGVLGAIVYDLFVGDVLRARGEPPAPDVEGFGETVEEQPTTADGQVEVRGRTVRER